MAGKENVVLVDRRDMEKLGKAIGKMGEQLGTLVEAFSAIAGEEPKAKPKKRKKRAAAETTEQPAQETAPAKEEPKAASQPAAAPKAPIKAPVVKAAAPKAPTKIPTPPKGNGSTKMPRQPGATH